MMYFSKPLTWLLKLKSILTDLLNQSTLSIPVSQERLDVIDISIAENWLMRSELLAICKQAIAARLTEREFSYTNVFTGEFKVLDALCLFFNTYFLPLVPLQRDHIAITPGASSGLDVLLSAICDPGDSVLVLGPYWNGFDTHFRIRAKVEPLLVQVENLDDCFDSMSIITALQQSWADTETTVKALILTNPHNPLGQCYSLQTLEDCAEFCNNHGIDLVLDEVYALSVFRSQDIPHASSFVSGLRLQVGKHSARFPLLRLHIIWSLSKDFCASGMRFGCVISQHNQQLIRECAVKASIHVSSLSSIYAAELLSSSNLEQMIAVNSARLSQSYHLMTAFLLNYGIPYIPASAGIFVFARLAPLAKTSDDELAVVKRFELYGIKIGPGSAYHIPNSEKGWFRLTFAFEGRQLEEIIRRMELCLC